MLITPLSTNRPGTMKRIACLALTLLAVPQVVQAQKTPAEIYAESAQCKHRAARTAQEIERMRMFGPQIWEDNVLAAQSHVEYALHEIEAVEGVVAAITNDANILSRGGEIDYGSVQKWIDDLRQFRETVRMSRRDTKKLRKSARRASRGPYAPMDWAQASRVYSELEANLKHLEGLIGNSIKVAKKALK